MRFVQLLLTDGQAELTAAALFDAEKALKDVPLEEDDPQAEDARQVGRLAMLFQDASENPMKYPPTGKMAATVRTIVRRSRGQAETPTRSKRRSSRHQRRRAERHIFRRNREFIEQYNRAVEINEAERKEAAAAAAEVVERTKDQPRFSIEDGLGNVLMTDIPAEFIIGEDGASLAPARIITAR